MKWISIAVVGPMVLATFLAVPIHLSITDSEVRVDHYASFRPEIFRLSDARSLTIVDAPKLRGSHVVQTRDVIVKFADGRQLRGSQVADGGSSVREDVLNLLINRTDLTPQYSSSAN